MLKRLNRTGIFALALCAGAAMLQPTTAKAADWHDRGEHHDSYRDRDGRGDRDRHEGRDWDRDRAWHQDRDRRVNGREYFYFNYSPAPDYRYPYNGYSNGAYPYTSYPSCPY